MHKLLHDVVSGHCHASSWNPRPNKSRTAPASPRSLDGPSARFCFDGTLQAENWWPWSAAANQISDTSSFLSTCLEQPRKIVPSATAESTKCKISALLPRNRWKICHSPHTAAISSHVLICALRGCTQSLRRRGIAARAKTRVDAKTATHATEAPPVASVYKINRGSSRGCSGTRLTGRVAYNRNHHRARGERAWRERYFFRTIGGTAAPGKHAHCD